MILISEGGVGDRATTDTKDTTLSYPCHRAISPSRDKHNSTISREGFTLLRYHPEDDRPPFAGTTVPHAATEAGRVLSTPTQPLHDTVLVLLSLLEH